MPTDLRATTNADAQSPSDNNDSNDADPKSDQVAVPSPVQDDVAAQAFEALFADFPLSVARQTSRSERRDKQLQSLSFVYGKVAFAPFRGVLDALKRWFHVLPRPGGVFLDLGSGSGKAVFVAALAHDFDTCYGVEGLEGLHALSQRALHAWDKRIKPAFALSQQKKRTRVTFALGDAAAGEWPTGAAAADVVFVNSTCFSEKLRRDISARLALSCKPGAIIITATHELPHAAPAGGGNSSGRATNGSSASGSSGGSFELLREMVVAQEAWGDATWFIHRKK